MKIERVRPVGSSRIFFEKGRILLGSGLFVNGIFSVIHSEQPKNTGAQIAAQTTSYTSANYQVQSITLSHLAPLAEVFNFRSSVRIYY